MSWSSSHHALYQITLQQVHANILTSAEFARVTWHADWAWTYEHYVRDVPGSFEFWMENMMDQSHVAYSHSGVAGNRSAS